MQGSQVYIAKFTPEISLINTRSNYQFWDGSTWNPNLSSAAPLFTWGNRTGVVTMTYIPLLKKYIMVVITPTYSPYVLFDLFCEFCWRVFARSTGVWVSLEFAVIEI